jgi:hypothetical protein
MKTKTLLMVTGAGALVYFLWKMASKPHPSTIRNYEECVANGYYWGNIGYAPACYQNEFDERR